MKKSVVALVASVGFVTFGLNSVQAEPRHWFYNDYGYYDGRAYQDRGYDRRYYGDRTYYQDDYYDDDDVIYEQPRRRHKKKRKWIKKRVRELIGLADQRFRKKERKRARRAEKRRLRQRANRQRLDDARHGEVWQNDPVQPLPRVYQPKKRQVKKVPRRAKLAYVPLPRVKPYHKIPRNLAVVSTDTKTENGDIKSFTLNGKQPSGGFDDRPSMSAVPKAVPKKETTAKIAPEKKDVISASSAKKEIEVAVKPHKPVEIKPIRIEIKKPKAAISRPATKRRVAVNQLSCNKAKTIVSDFGFSDVTARTCTGSIYDFSAKRDGNPYTVKVSSLSGELKGVQRVK